MINSYFCMSCGDALSLDSDYLRICIHCGSDNLLYMSDAYLINSPNFIKDYMGDVPNSNIDAAGGRQGV